MGSKTIVVSLPSTLGPAETKRRLQDGVQKLRTQFAGQIASLEDSWAGDRMNFKVTAMNQTVTGRIDVQADSVRIEMDLPWMLAMIAEKVKGEIEKRGRLLLDKK